MGEKYRWRSAISSVPGVALMAAALGCGGASATFPEKDASTADVSMVGSGSSSGGFGDETETTSSSGSSGSSSGGFSGDAATSSSGSGDGSVVEAGDASGVTGPDAGGDAAPTESGTSACAALCEGCCDSNGKCVTGGTVAVCGKSGASCEDCSKNSCIISSAPCCTTAGKCGCAVAGFVACD